MMSRAFTTLAIVSTLLSAGCTVDQTAVPALAGPSSLATSLVVTATPDLVFLKGDQSVVIVEARDAAGAALANLRVHLGLQLAGLASTCGSLSATDVVTGADGRAVVVFTAPKLPLPQPECANFGGTVTVAATPVSTNAQTSRSFTASIQMLTPGSTTTTAGGFQVNFTISPNPGVKFVPISFSDAGSVSPGHAITSYQWTWSDGAAKSGSSVTHDFTPGTHTVTLTITDDIGQSGSKSALVTVN